jgi:hypothetical protein
MVVLILVIYVAVDFRRPLPPLPDYLGPDNYNGLSAIAVMPISLISATIFSEAMWQRYAPTTHHRLRAPCPLANRGPMLCFDTPCFGVRLSVFKWRVCRNVAVVKKTLP